MAYFLTCPYDQQNMDARLLDSLRNATSLELYELSVAVDRLLSDPARILEVRRHLHLGAQVMYLDSRRGTMMPGRVVQFHPAHAVVEDGASRARWKLPYAAIAVDPSLRSASPEPVIPPRVDVSAFKVGDTVGFTDKHLRERIGTVIRLNAKTCSLLVDGEQWRVSPGLLRKVIDL